MTGRPRFTAPGWCAILVAVGAAFPGLSAEAASLSVEVEPVVLGQQEVVALEIIAPSRGGPETLRVAVNVGRIEGVEPIGADRYRARFRLPETRFPQVAMVGVWHETGDDRPEVSVFRIPLHGVTRIPVTTEPGATVFVHVGGERFGPMRVDASGSAVVPITVAPGLRHAVVEVRDETGVPARRRVVVEVPDYNRLLAVMVPARLVSVRGRSGRLEVHYASAEAEGDVRIRVLAEDGEVSLVSEEAGRHVFRFVPPRVPESREVALHVFAEDDPTSSADLTVTVDTPDPIGLSDLSAGLRVGMVHSFREMVGPRFGLELSLPIHMEVVDLVVGASLGYGHGTLDGGDTLVHLVPLTLRASQPLLRQGPVTAGVGVGGTAVFGLRRTPSTGASGSGFGLGAHLFFEAAFALGVGAVFVEMGVGFAPVPTGPVTISGGGLGLDAGFRIPLY
jgi:hypothetical protein